MNYSESLQRLITELDTNTEQQLHLLLAHNNVENVQELAQHLLAPHYKRGHLLSPLYKRARDGESESVRQLLANGADPNHAESNNRTPLWAATEKGHTGIVEQLLQAGAIPNINSGDYGTTPLFVAAQKDFREITRLLLEFGANTELATNAGSTPLWAATKKGHAEIVQQLLQAGALPNINFGNYGTTPLFVAAQQDFREIARLLLEFGANTELATNLGNTPLYTAINKNNDEMIRLLVTFGADVNKQNLKGITALYQAVSKVNPELVLYLLMNGANPNIAQEDGSTPLHTAVLKKNPDMVKLLLVFGANPALSTIKGSTAYAFATKLGDEDIKREIINALSEITVEQREEIIQQWAKVISQPAPSEKVKKLAQGEPVDIPKGKEIARGLGAQYGACQDWVKERYLGSEPEQLIEQGVLDAVGIEQIIANAESLGVDFYTLRVGKEKICELMTESIEYGIRGPRYTKLRDVRQVWDQVNQVCDNVNDYTMAELIEVAERVGVQYLYDIDDEHAIYTSLSKEDLCEEIYQRSEVV